MLHRASYFNISQTARLSEHHHESPNYKDDKGGGRLGLDFHGRGRLASSKNMQLENSQGKPSFRLSIHSINY
jgi:hypothetical protein